MRELIQVRPRPGFGSAQASMTASKSTSHTTE